MSTNLFTLIIAILFYCFDFYLRISTSLIVNQLMVQYHITASGIGMMSGAFYIGYTFMQVPGGILLDRIQFHKLMQWTIAVCILAFAIFVKTDILWIGILCRFLVGVGSAVSFIAVLYITKQYFPTNWFVFISGITISLGTLSASIAQSVIANLINIYPWQSVFLFSNLIGLLLMAVFYFMPKDLTAVEPALENNQSQNSFLQDLKYLLTDTRLLAFGLIGGIYYFPTSVFTATWGIEYLNIKFGLDKTNGTTAIMFLFLGWAIFSPVVGIFSNSLKRMKNIASGSALMACLLMLMIIFTKNLSVLEINLILFLFGSFSSGQVTVWAFFNRFVKKTMAGSAVAFVNMLIMLSAAGAQMLVGYFIERHHLQHTVITHDYTIHDFQFGLMILPIALLSVSLLIFMNNRQLS